MITIEYDKHGLAGVWSDHIDEDIWPQLTYLIGHDVPHYPVPAIRQGFEFGQSWPDGKCVLIEWKQERFDT